MRVTNDSPFSYFAFESLGSTDEAIEVVVSRGTVDIVGTKLVPAAVHEPVLLADQYRDLPHTASVRVDTDLVPQKLSADITLNAVAHAAGGKPTSSWPVTVRVGRVSKELRVFGPRFWQHNWLKGWGLSTADAVTAIPIHYELAFGGRYFDGDSEVVFEPNPVGIGFAFDRLADRASVIPAPQIECANQPIVEFGSVYAPAGFGPIAKHCLPRRDLCGTANDRWKATRWPLRPSDFDFRYYNSGSPGLVYPGFLRGDEDVLLAGLSSDGAIEFALPGISLTLFGLSHENEITLESMLLDTLHIDTTTMQVFLTWRATVQKTSGLKSIQIVPEPVKEPAVRSFVRSSQHG